MNKPIEKDLLIVAKTMPVLSQSHEETVCTGAISEDGTWYRLYPVTFRYLEEGSKYTLWSWVRVKIRKYVKDDRKETYTPEEESIQVLDRKFKTDSQKINFLSPFIHESLEDLKEKYKQDKTSVGMIRVNPEKFYWEKDSREWDEKHLAILNQQHLFHNKKPLDKIPYKFKLKYKCADNSKCKGHDQSILIWNFQEGYRQFAKKYGSEEAALEKINEKAMKDYFSEDRACFAIVGNLRAPKLRNIWIIGGLFTPKKISLAQQSLF